MTNYPPSPALSACDSLDGMDLDALLASQGSLSHFPTPPPPKKTPIVHTLELLADDLDCDEMQTVSQLDYLHIATMFAEKASIDMECIPDSIDSVRRALVRADLPLEVVAVAFNMLTALHTRVLGLGTFNDTPPDLLVVAALNLAVSYNLDFHPVIFWWSVSVCNGAWTVKRINQTIFRLFEALDYRIREYSKDDRIERTMLSLLLSPEPESTFSDAQVGLHLDSRNIISEADSVPAPSSLEKIAQDRQDNSDSSIAQDKQQDPGSSNDSTASGHWIHGQVTPEASPPPLSPPHAAELGLRMPLRRFIPLL